MGTCFVMQPFDSGKFDKRYKDIFEPAIRNANLEPYRVDQDPKVRVPIQDIERGIRDSKLCFAEITLDNPNVCFELGYAFASGKDIVLVCSDERGTKFPFDIQHRAIITYSTSSTSDFDKLKQDITNKLKAFLSLQSDTPQNDSFHTASIKVIDEFHKEAEAHSFVLLKVQLAQMEKGNDLERIKLGSPFAVVLQHAFATFYAHMIDKDGNLIGEITNPFSEIKKNGFIAGLVSVLDAITKFNGLTSGLSMTNPIVLKNADIKNFENGYMELALPAKSEDFFMG